MSDIRCVVTKMSVLLGNEEASRQFKEMTNTQWKEVDHRRKSSDLDLDFDKYIQMEELGCHYMVVAYHEGQLVGYNSIFITESPHTRELTALTDTIFIKKSYRKRGVGVDMIKLAEEAASSKGAKHFMVTFKNDSPHPSIVEELGFFSYETIYAKQLGD